MKMYGDQYSSTTLQSTNQIQYTNQYSNSKDDYSIDNTHCKTLPHQHYPIKEESNLLDTSFNSTQLLATTLDQWQMNNYYDTTNAYSLASQSELACSQSSLSRTNLLPNHPNQMAAIGSSHSTMTGIESNVQSNIQLNVQNNTSLHIVNNTHHASNVQTNIHPTSAGVSQFIDQEQHTNLPAQSINKTYNTFADYSPKDTSPLTKKIKSEKVNFNLDYCVHNPILSDYFPSSSTTNKNQVRQSVNISQSNFQQPYEASVYSNQAHYDLSAANLSTTTGANYYVEQPQPMINNQPYPSSSTMKSDQLDYTNLNSTASLINRPDAQRNSSTNTGVHQKKFLIENNSSLKHNSLSNQIIQSSHSTNHQSINRTTNRNTYSTHSLNTYLAQSSSSSNINQFSLSNPIHRPPIKQMTVKQCIRKKVIENQLQKSNSNKLVDRKVPNNFKLSINTNRTMNQNQRNKSTGLVLDEEDKKIRRRERNKVAATKCRNKKKAHVDKLKEEHTNLDAENSWYHSHIEALKREEEQLIQLLFNHRTVCQLDQLCQSDQYINFNNVVRQQSSMTDSFGQNDFSQPNENQSLKNMNRIKMESNYDLKLGNQMIDLNNQNQFNNQQEINYEPPPPPPPPLIQPNPIIKIEEYYSSNQLTNLSTSDQLPPPSYSSHTYVSSNQPNNYNNQYNQSDHPNYGMALTNPNMFKESNEGSSTNLTNLDYLCTNTDTPNINTQNDVFLTSC